jgi:hypothetical protein
MNDKNDAGYMESVVEILHVTSASQIKGKRSIFHLGGLFLVLTVDGGFERKGMLGMAIIFLFVH